ncbi:2-C-methyl-D-erythritol 4-phosphate cytidylyltransferase [Ihubacter massiliensis]|uniref:Ribitol-5-phosphate cytidylyltransferase n=1 Tax=Hominibacterium faecale TaxID=2839743 RepID=A0A9J6QMP2_9FIRM|nr:MULTISPECIES: 2-C-methyl-D-erythritol 4-phosphate cytidylyltransferase [Eubacteriales Family XIII. Incertae Sedis]MCC2864715.1 2-C-methyl-D-erythritol 4-phosphate cytidylyltransferase [Anaerovorax odorimutans]MCO7123771.1 2-C-methyl-D-erythritol 4-phosphate cytidylyltransferase [Ihubacter massiliensis]MCU7378696.1 2-C-methyl-D-erythritol 4-phosphate cytidylyltransferase [Hominibacterium faecale]
MIFGAILAGGVGTRMGNSEKPKQYMLVGGKPIIAYTVEAFSCCSKIDITIVLCPNDWVAYTNDLLTSNGIDMNKVVVTAGGTMRNDTIMNAVNYIEEHYELNDDTVILTHDAVRPFVTERIIEDNINTVMKYGACDTVIAATDTIVESTNGKVITNIPDRAYLYQGQTPQSFKAKAFKELYSSLTEQEKEVLTDAAKVFVLKGQAVNLVRGETYNIKITYPSDLQLAESLLGDN